MSCLAAAHQTKHTLIHPHRNACFSPVDAKTVSSSTSPLYLTSVITFFGREYFIHVQSVLRFLHRADYRLASRQQATEIKMYLSDVTPCRHVIRLPGERELKCGLIASHVLLNPL